MRINFDLDGTIADLYGVDNWLEMLLDSDTTPYEIARPLVRLCVLARYLNRLQQAGAELSIISWGCKGASANYDNAVAIAKNEWLNKHLPSVKFDEIIIIPYGTPKENYCYSIEDVLFDDEEHNRNQWQGIAYDEKNILKNLKTILDNL